MLDSLNECKSSLVRSSFILPVVRSMKFPPRLVTISAYQVHWAQSSPRFAGIYVVPRGCLEKIGLQTAILLYA